MARLPRLVIPNQPLHIMHRGNNRQDIFETEDDMYRIKNDIECALDKTKCILHAYVIMTNHLHLLVTPQDKDQLSQFMQIMANRYVRYFNALHDRTGSIWEGRYKSSVIDSEAYLLTLYRYIEQNPVSANMVKQASEYRWSSYGHNAKNEPDALITEHEEYMRLGQNPQQRRDHYQSLFKQPINDRDKITLATDRGEVFGTSSFHEKMSKLATRSTRLSRHGGDRKSDSYKDQAG